MQEPRGFNAVIFAANDPASDTYLAGCKCENSRLFFLQTDQPFHSIESVCISSNALQNSFIFLQELHLLIDSALDARAQKTVDTCFHFYRRCVCIC